MEASIKEDLSMEIDPPFKKNPATADDWRKALNKGSAYTGPPLTSAEALVAIHDISPEKDCLSLKKEKSRTDKKNLAIQPRDQKIYTSRQNMLSLSALSARLASGNSTHLLGGILNVGLNNKI
ncbi:hypothetical protein C2S52_007339 [Perilla frutescens var. hirtella]|nr:hypothetical protein C2S52_007339 [Perilla frutescens var. hirtella]